MSDLSAAMDKIANLEDKNKVKVKGGKYYTQVVTRVEMFRREFGMDYGIETSVSEFSGGILAKATVLKTEDSGIFKTIGQGHAWAAEISKEKCIEALETTAVGRALASIGLSGGEYCSANEIDTYEDRYEKPTNEQREVQTEAIDGLYNFDNLTEFDTYDPDVSTLPDLLKGTYENQKAVCRDVLSNGMDLECPGYRFIGVQHALRWMKAIPDTLNGMSAQFEIDRWVEVSQRRIDALDTMLSAKKYVKDGRKPSVGVQGKIDERKQQIEEGIAA